MPEPKKKLNAEQKKKLNSYIDQLAFRNSVIKNYNKKGINIVDKKFQNINFKNDTIAKISRTHLGDNKRIYSYNIDKKFDQYNKLSGRVELSNETKKRKNVLGTSYQTDTKIIKYNKKGPLDKFAPYRTRIDGTGVYRNKNTILGGY